MRANLCRIQSAATPFLILMLLCGCATGYKPLGYMGGFADQQIGENAFKVAFAGNGYTARQKVHRGFLRRCAEVTLAHSCDYFVIQRYEDFLILSKNDSGSPLVADIDIFKGSLPLQTPGAFEARKVLAEMATREVQKDPQPSSK